MDKKIDKIKRHLLERYCVSLGKQCTQEYIVYYFYLDHNKSVIKRYEKVHYKNNKGYVKKREDIETKINIQKFLDIICDLLNRGYELEID